MPSASILVRRHLLAGKVPLHVLDAYGRSPFYL